MQGDIYLGNAVVDGQKSKFWIAGQFMAKYNEGSQNDPRVNHNVEIKWGVHKKGDKKVSLAKQKSATTLTILISGKFLNNIDGKQYLLEKQGDYLVYGPNLFHNWEAIEDTVIATIRWPSVQDDTVSE